MPISKKLYAERKQKGLCTICGKPAKSNRTLCSIHLAKANQNQKAVVAKRKAKGLCAKCGEKLTNNRKMCNPCLNTRVEMDRPDEYIPVKRRRELDLCRYCGQSSKKYQCDACRQKYVKSIQNNRSNRGICIICGKEPASKGKKRCVTCLDKLKKWYASSESRIRLAEQHRSLRMRAIKHYGGKCACCGETEYTFLAIDHIDGGGNEHRKAIKKSSGGGIVTWLIRHDYPDGFQILCHNCNMSKHINKGVCAHKIKIS